MEISLEGMVLMEYPCMMEVVFLSNSPAILSVLSLYILDYILRSE